MREYEIKRGQYKNLEGDGLRKLIEELFGPAKEDGEGYLVASFGALKSVRAKILAKDKLSIDSETDRSASMEVAAQTMQLWNDFLERATGYNAKQRAKRVQEAAKKADAAAKLAGGT